MSDLEMIALPDETVRADDALLDGRLTAVPDARQPAAAALAALRAAAQPAELDREAAALAAFRMFRPGETGAGPHHAGPYPGRPHRRQPHRRQPHRRQPHRRLGPHRGQAAGLLGAAAAVIVAFVLAVSLSGGRGSGPAVPRLPDTHAVPSGGEQKVEGGAAIPATPAPASSAAGPKCRHSGMYHHGCAGLTAAPPPR
jgi:hypothetical protein